MSDYPINSKHVIDSRDVIEAIRELSEETRNMVVDSDEKVALLMQWANLKTLADEASDHCEDWQYGATLIRDSYFEEYARFLADDLGLIPNNVMWPCTCIDWEQASRELRMDYTAIDFDGVTYWVRA